MSAPYREGLHALACPRCAETIDELRRGLFACVRCAGLWIASSTIAEAFGAAPWPGGHAVWWRNELACPECAAAGTTAVMTARAVDDVIVDHCASHGVWLDRGELARLMHGTGDDLIELRTRLGDTAPLSEDLAERRARWRETYEIQRKRAAEAFQRALAAMANPAPEAPSVEATPAAPPVPDARAIAAARALVQQERDAILARMSAMDVERKRHRGAIGMLETQIGDARIAARQAFERVAALEAQLAQLSTEERAIGARIAKAETELKALEPAKT